MKLSNNAENPVLVAALRYASEMEWRVLPVHGIRNGACTCSKGTKCSRPGKHPATPNGVHDATSDEATIRKWFAHGHCYNVALATGRSSNTVVLDVDPRNGGDKSLSALASVYKTPPTVKSRTGGGGAHYFFEYDERTANAFKKGQLGAGLDFQSDGQIVILPPSRHVSGSKYMWIAGRNLDRAMSKVPEEWVSHNMSLNADGREKDSAAVRVHDEGGRNSALASLAGTLVNTAMSPEAILAALQSENAQNCKPPLSETEVRGIAASISRYPVHAGGDDAEAFAQVVMDCRFEGGKHLVLGPDGRLWRFGQTQWSPMRDEDLSKIVLELSNETGIRFRMAKTALLQQVRTLLRAKASIDGDPLKFNSEPHPVINCENGELWVAQDGSVELKPHSASSYLRHTLTVRYDVLAKCPTYDKAITEIFGRSTDPTGLIGFWHEVCGYTLQPSRWSALIVIAKGSGSNGKTALTGTLMRMLGHDLVIATPVQNLEKSRFASAGLVGKYLLIDDDVKAGTRLPDGELKKLSEGKSITGEHKFGDQFTFIARVVPMLLCNNYPSIADLSPGLKRRLAVVPFEQSFLREAEDTQLFKRIWNIEMPGILNHYLLGLKRVAARGWRFDPPEAVVRATDEFIQGANPLPEFIKTMCSEGIKKHCRVEYLYENFGAWTKANGITYAQQQASFRKNLEHLGFGMKKMKDGLHVFGLTLNTLDSD